MVGIVTCLACSAIQSTSNSRVASEEEGALALEALGLGAARREHAGAAASVGGVGRREYARARSEEAQSLPTTRPTWNRMESSNQRIHRRRKERGGEGKGARSTWA